MSVPSHLNAPDLLATWRDRELLRTREVAQIADCHISQVYRAIDRGELKGVKIGGALRVTVASVRALLGEEA